MKKPGIRPKKIESQKDGSIIFEAQVAGTDEIKFWLMTWGSKAEILSPAALRDEMISEAEAMLHLYENK